MNLAQTRGSLSAVMLAGIALLLTSGCSPGARGAQKTSTAELVPVGYGTQHRSDVTGAISSVSLQDDRPRNVARVEELLEGRVAGARVVRDPRGGLSVQIRGIGSINGSTEPLYVIDGVPITGGAPGSALLGINPSDIARIEVLKDAGSTAIYGSRAANGVILITTRRH